MRKPTNSGAISESANFRMEKKAVIYHTDADTHKPTLLAELEDSTPLMSKTDHVYAYEPEAVSVLNRSRDRIPTGLPPESLNPFPLHCVEPIRPAFVTLQ
jgi:hypothetical protein